MPKAIRILRLRWVVYLYFVRELFVVLALASQLKLELQSKICWLTQYICRSLICNLHQWRSKNLFGVSSLLPSSQTAAG